MQYDALGQALVRTASDGSRTERKYDLLGRVLEQTDRLGGQASISRWQYDTGTKAWASWSAWPGRAIARRCSTTISRG